MNVVSLVEPDVFSLKLLQFWNSALWVSQIIIKALEDF